MMQFYFLSVFLNLLAACALIPKARKPHMLLGISEILESRNARLFLGCLVLAVGCFKLISPVRGDFPYIGDLFPAAAGIAAGIVLLLPSDEASGNAFGVLRRFAAGRQAYIGYAVLAAALLHFLFPSVVIL